MKVTNFNKSTASKYKAVSKLLKEQFEVKLGHAPSKASLTKMNEGLSTKLTNMRNKTKRYHTNPEYVKYMSLKEATSIMLTEGMYADSPKFKEMKQMVSDIIANLMDSGYNSDEASAECMHSVRRDNRFSWPDEVIHPIVLAAAQEYFDMMSAESEMGLDADLPEPTDVRMSESVMQSIANECGVDMSKPGAMESINARLEEYAAASGRTNEAILGFLNGLDDKDVDRGVGMFSGKLAGPGEKELVIDNKEESTDMAFESNMFSDLLAEILNEDVDIEQAEVVMAVRALADDLQGQIERIGKMINEDVPAIADQIRSEMGSEAAEQFSSSMTQTLNQQIETTRSAKSEVDNTVSRLSGDAPAVDDMGMGADIGDASADLGGDMGAGDALSAADDMVDDLDIGDGAPLGRPEL